MWFKMEPSVSKKDLIMSLSSELLSAYREGLSSIELDSGKPRTVSKFITVRSQFLAVTSMERQPSRMFHRVVWHK
jgi:hypothetical protein